VILCNAATTIKGSGIFYEVVVSLTFFIPSGFPTTISTVTAWFWQIIQIPFSSLKGRYC